METPESSGWVSVRCLFRWMRKEEQLYEERVTLWRTGDLDDAIARAEVEASAYAAGSTDPSGWSLEYLGLAQAFLIADEVADGAEVFSLLRVHNANPAEYLTAFFDTGTERQQVNQ